MISSNYFLEHVWLIPFSPLATAVFMVLLGRFLPKEGGRFANAHQDRKISGRSVVRQSPISGSESAGSPVETTLH